MTHHSITQLRSPAPPLGRATLASEGPSLADPLASTLSHPRVTILPMAADRPALSPIGAGHPSPELIAWRESQGVPVDAEPRHV